MSELSADPRAKAAHILIVDDEENIRSTLAEFMVTMNGYDGPHGGRRT